MANSNFEKLLESKGLVGLQIHAIDFKEENKTLFLNIETRDESLIDEEKIKSIISDRFPNLTIKLNIKLTKARELDEKYIIDFYNNFMTSNVSIAPIEKFEIKIDGLNIILLGENKIISDYLSNTNFSISLKNDILNKLNMDYQVKIDYKSDIEFENALNSAREHSENMVTKFIADNPIKTKTNSQNIETLKKDTDFYIGRKIKDPAIDISSLNKDTIFVTVAGEVFNLDSREIANKKQIVSFYLADDTSAVACKAFWSEEIFTKFSENIKNGSYVQVNGKYEYDNYSKCNCINIKSLALAEKTVRKDLSTEKRVELRLHTQMSSLNGFTDVKELFKTLKSWGHPKVGVTDKSVVQAFPNVMNLASDNNIKALYGMDAVVVEDYIPIFISDKSEKPRDTFVVYDIETTGLSQLTDRITEIGAVKIKDGKIIESYGQLVNPEKVINEKIAKLTGIDNDMVKDKPTIAEVLPEFLEFCKGSTLVAHNAEFDVSFIRQNAYEQGLDFDFSYIDTLYLARALEPKLKNHKLDTLTRHFDVKLLNHHRAVDDATATGEVFIKLLKILDHKGIKLDDKINYMDSDWNLSATPETNVLLYCKNKTGLKNLYQLVSYSHTESIYKSPKIPRSLLDKHREGLIFGSGDYYGSLYQTIVNHVNEEKLEKLAKYFDFLEVFPRSNFTHLVETEDSRFQIESLEFIDKVNKKIIDLGEKFNIPVVATGNVYFLNPNDSIYRKIIRTVEFNKNPDICDNYYLKTTDEMLNEFMIYGKDKAYELVIKNTNLIADSLEDIKPIPPGKFPPELEGASDELRRFTFEKARSIYGEKLPEIVEKRLERELNSIISNGYASLYMVARKLVLKSNEDGYLVGSRGSVGSSFAATMAGITEVNPLKAHYVCPKCKFSDFDNDPAYDSGLDLPKRKCPVCGEDLNRDGQNIPFEVFLGFKGNKEPDIDLNFAGEYQPICHKYTETIFGEKQVIRAGTIGTIAENTAYGYILKYFKIKNPELTEEEIKADILSNAYAAYLQRGIVGCKRTTSQHPGGIIVVPQGYDIEDFTPVNYPADDASGGIKTTHFTYKAVHDTILKLDLLGHDVPSIIKMLTDLTHEDPLSIPFGDEDTLEIFHSLKSLKITNDSYNNGNIGTLGIPEFGTSFVRNMLEETKPTTFAELVRISGVSHGESVWLGNARDLIMSGQAELKDTICTRDDIMTFLISKNLDANMSFKIMESVRKGKGLSEEQKSEMEKLDLPSWYIDSCLKIKYMFPKAHAVAYVMMSYRIAYCKVHNPTAFYATYFTTKIQDFVGSVILDSLEIIRYEMENIKKLPKRTAKDDSKYSVYELAEEMYCRGYEFEKASFNESDAKKFLISKDNKIIPPLSALDGVSEQCAIDIKNALKDGPFISIEDFSKRTKANKNAIESLKQFGLLSGMQETNQLDLFGFL